MPVLLLVALPAIAAPDWNCVEVKSDPGADVDANKTGWRCRQADAPPSATAPPESATAPPASATAPPANVTARPESATARPESATARPESAAVQAAKAPAKPGSREASTDPDRTITPATAPLPAALDHASTERPVLDSSNLAAQDWTSLEQARQSGTPLPRQAIWCGGYYQNPVSTSEQQQSGELPITASADSTTMEQNNVVLQDNVLVTRGSMTLQADQATINRETQTAELKGNVIIRSPDVAFGGSSATVDMDSQDTSIADANYVVHQAHIRGTAKSISANAEQQVSVRKGSYTACAPDSKLWQLKASRLDLDHKKGQGTARHARVSVKGIPVAYVPWAMFPLGDERQSGLLFPSLSDDSDGFDITLPYYFNIAPNIDATLAPRYNESRGYITEANLRWLNRFDQWDISGAYIDKDEVFVENQGNNESGKRWVANIRERGRLGDHFITRVDYTRTSDARYLRDLNTTSLSINRSTHLSQRAQMQYLNDRWSIGFNVQQYQTIDEDRLEPYESIPELWINYEGIERPFTLSSDVSLHYTAFSHSHLLEGERGFGELDIKYPLRWGGLSVVPAIGVQHLAYQLDDAPAITDDEPSVTTPQAWLDARLLFAREKTRGKWQGISQTLEPGLFYLYREDKPQDQLPLFDTDELTFNTRQLTRDTRLSGYDRLESANQLSVHLTHRLLGKSGQERMKTTLGQIFFFEDRQALTNQALRIGRSNTDSTSLLAADISTRWSPTWQSRTTTLWDTGEDRVDEGSFAIIYRGANRVAGSSRYRDASDRIANLAYHFRRQDDTLRVLQNDIELADFSFVTPMFQRWSLIGRYQYDISSERHNEYLAGLAFNNCCVRLRMVYRDGLVYQQDPQDRERDKSIYLQIQLKGLFGVGGTVESVLDDAIFGYGSTSNHYLDNASYHDYRANKHTSF